jgi:NAD(P)-dependent dehydrogenase (short-subunit alcohol dehydrogenase family)
MKRKVLITGATGDTGRAAVKEALALGLDVRAMVHGKDERSSALEKLGAEVVLGDLLEINTIRAAMEGVDAAYFCWPVKPGLIHATVNFAQAAKEAGVSTVINYRSARQTATLRVTPAGIALLPNRYSTGRASPPFISVRLISLNGSSTRGSSPICSRAFSECQSARDDIRQSRRMIRAAPSRCC